MNANDKTAFYGGLAMVLLAIVTLLTVVFTATGQGEYDPFERGEVAKYLADIDDNRSLVFAQIGFAILGDGVLALIVAAAVFTLFRDRGFFLATIALVGILAGVTVSLVVDMITMLTLIVARDFVEGGATGVGAGDPAILELGRILAISTFVGTNVLFTAIGLALVSLGVLLARAPLGAMNPPRWLGWVAIVGGAACWLSWLVVVADPFFVFFPINLIATLILFFGLGGWLMTRGSQESLPAASTAPAAA